MAGTGKAPPETMEATVKELFDLESATNKELTEVLARLKTIRNLRDKTLNDPKSKANQEIDAVEAKIAAAVAKKEALYTTMNAARGQTRQITSGDQQASNSEHLSILRLKRGPLQEAEKRLSLARKQAATALLENKVKADRIRARLPDVPNKKGDVATLEEVKKEMKRMEEKAKAAEKNPQRITVVEHLRGQIKQYERAQPQLEEYWQLVGAAFDAKAKEMSAASELQQVTAELKAIEAEMDERMVKQKPPDGDQGRSSPAASEKNEFIYEEIKALTKEIETLRREKGQLRDALRGAEGGKPSPGDEIKEASVQRDLLFDKLKEIRAKIPSKTVSYDKTLHSDLIGARGATVQNLQEEFGVILNVSFERGEVEIKGGEEDIEACHEALVELLKNAQDSRNTATLRYDVGVSRELIGPGGSNIQRLQEASGARLNVDSKAGKIVIVGPQAALTTAQQMLEEFFANNTRVVLNFKREIADAVVGRGGKTVRRIQEESGVKNINIKKEAGTIEMIGSQAAVAAAKAQYEDLIRSYQAGGMEMKLAPEMVGAIVGKGGASVMKIQDETGCMITVNRAPAAGGKGAKGGYATVSIKGPSTGVTAARAMIEDILQSNREGEKVPFDPSLLLFLIRPPKDDPDGPCPLERIKRETGCQRVEALRAEKVVVVSGRKDSTAAAVKLLEALLQENARETVRVPYTAVLFGVIGVRTEGRDSAMDTIRKECGCESVSADKSGIISIVGEKAAATAAKERVEALLAELTPDIETMTLTSERVLPALIGSGGQTITRLRRDHHAEISLDRDTLIATVYAPAAERAKVMEAMQRIMAEAKG